MMELEQQVFSSKIVDNFKQKLRHRKIKEISYDVVLYSKNINSALITIL